MLTIANVGALIGPVVTLCGTVTLFQNEGASISISTHHFVVFTIAAKVVGLIVTVRLFILIASAS